MDDHQEIEAIVRDAFGEDCCGSACCEMDLFTDDGVWMIQLEGFMAPWPLGRTAAEVKAALAAYAQSGLGMA
ncbi:MAG: hypothetical protein PVF20_10160 [Desulfobacterales bacterium]|jgi:hypothetical protein